MISLRRAGEIDQLRSTLLHAAALILEGTGAAAENGGISPVSWLIRRGFVQSGEARKRLTFAEPEAIEILAG